MKLEADYPRTLIVGTQFTEQSGAGTFLGRLFSNWQEDRLATVCGGVLEPDWSRCHRHYRTGDMEFRLQAPFRWLVPPTASGPVDRTSMNVTPRFADTATISSKRRFAQFSWRALLRALAGGEILYNVAPSKQLLAWIRDFQPEVIYGHCSSLNSVRFLHRLQKALGLPIVLHVMDDWSENYYLGNGVARVLRRHYLNEFEELIESAKSVIVICQEMAGEYEKRYQRRVLSLPLPVEMSTFEGVSRNCWKAESPFRIRYGGRVGWAIHECLADIARAVHALRQNGVDVEFDLVTFQKEHLTQPCFTLNGVNVKDPSPLAELPRILTEYDVLIICYDFDLVSFRQSRFSMPSKLTECMASGTPILVYGPAGLPVVEYARREGWGKLVDSNNPAVLKNAIMELMNSSALREQLGRTARRLAVERHCAALVSENLREIIKKSIDDNVI